jgi:hypothetical protein
LQAAVASSAPPDQGSADLQGFCFDALFFESFKESPKQMVRVTPCAGAAVEADDLHEDHSPEQDHNPASIVAGTPTFPLDKGPPWI